MKRKFCCVAFRIVGAVLVAFFESQHSDAETNISSDAIYLRCMGFRIIEAHEGKTLKPPETYPWTEKYRFASGQVSRQYRSSEKTPALEIDDQTIKWDLPPITPYRSSYKVSRVTGILRGTEAVMLPRGAADFEKTTLGIWC